MPDEPISKRVEEFILNGTQASWNTLALMNKELQADWSQFRAEPMDPTALRHYQLIRCDTDDEAIRLCAALVKRGRKLHPDCGTAGLYHTIGWIATKITMVDPTGYHVLPAHMFL